MSSKLELKGLTEFQRALHNLPEDLAEEASVVVQAQADEARRQIQVAYAEGPTGNLRRGVTKEENRSKFTSRGIVRSRAKHANLWEQQTPPKKRRTAKGYNRGTMRATPDNQKMIPIAIRRRRVMVEALKDIVRKAGFQVNE